MAKNILIIDDDSSICEIMDILLTEEGYIVKALPDGNNLEKEIDLFHPHLFIIDYLMPGKNGAEIARCIRMRHDTKNSPIIMVAANQKYRKESIGAGVNVFMNKPFDIYELLSAVKDNIYEER